uniref:Synaptophysin-like 2a n=1 Tax=Salarias fasciatus TaxID=181472 RepID=A0A672I2E6_SALFA
MVSVSARWSVWCVSTLTDSLRPQIFTIFAFGTAGGYYGSTHFTVNCTNKEVQNISASFQYPFRLQASTYSMTACNGTQLDRVLQGDFSSSAEFFVCVGCSASFTAPPRWSSTWASSTCTVGPAADLLLTAAFAFLWLVSSSAWGKGLTDVKWATNPEHLVELCKDVCKPGEFPTMGRLNASVIFGFLNLILWAGNCWFIYKETPFHKDPNQQANMEGGGVPGH